MEQSEIYTGGGEIYDLRIVCQYPEVTIHGVMAYISSGKEYQVSERSELGKDSCRKNGQESSSENLRHI